MNSWQFESRAWYTIHTHTRTSSGSRVETERLSGVFKSSSDRRDAMLRECDYGSINHGIIYNSDAFIRFSVRLHSVYEIRCSDARSILIPRFPMLFRLLMFKGERKREECFMILDAEIKSQGIHIARELRDIRVIDIVSCEILFYFVRYSRCNMFRPCYTAFG